MALKIRSFPIDKTVRWLPHLICLFSAKRGVYEPNIDLLVFLMFLSSEVTTFFLYCLHKEDKYSAHTIAYFCNNNR
jgi:hypothetical protein